MGDENCSCLTNIIVKCNWPYSFPLSKLYFKHQQCKIKIKVLKNVIRTIDGSSMLKLRRDDLQLFLIHYSFLCLFCIVICGQYWIWNWLQTPLQKRLQTPLHVLQHAVFPPHISLNDTNILVMSTENAWWYFGFNL